MNDQLPTPAPQGGDLVLDPEGIQRQVARDALIVSNLRQEVLLVPANAVRLRLRDFEEYIRAQGAWSGPAGFALGLLANLLSLRSATTFEPLFWMNKDAWFGVNVAGLLVCLFFTGRAVLRVFRDKQKGTVEGVIADLKKSAEGQPTA